MEVKKTSWTSFIYLFLFVVFFSFYDDDTGEIKKKSKVMVGDDIQRRKAKKLEENFKK